MPSEISSRLLHVVSPWIDLLSADPLTANISKQVLLQEVAYASFCGAANILLYGPSFACSASQSSKLAIAIRQALAAAPNVAFSILLPLSPNINAVDGAFEVSNSSKIVTNHLSDQEPSNSVNALSSWDVWHAIRVALKYDNRLSVALSIPHSLPATHVLSRWASEPLRLLELPATSFTPNKYNVSVLAKSHQAVISRYLRQKVPPWLLLSGIGRLPGVSEAPTFAPISGERERNSTSSEVKFATLPPQQVTPHLMYLREHVQRRQPVRNALERYGAGFQDWPQSPLQPLADNLDSVTYEVFEKDPVKYAWYECAVRMALEDYQRHAWPGGSTDGKLLAVVVGAGRGPLVQRILQASKAVGVDVDVWALEKNPNAFVHLQKRNLNEWSGQVNLVHGDMRSWAGPTDRAGLRMSVNILVSELLGSLADNELSPECLDGVQHLLHPTHGISIPSSYSAFATPVSAPELWRSIRFRNSPNLEASKYDPLMLPYVSWLHAVDYLAVQENETSVKQSMKDISKAQQTPEIAKLWDFEHPIPQKYLQSTFARSNTHNERSAHHTFRVRHRGVCHGIAGYFESPLYDRSATHHRLAAHAGSPNTTRQVKNHGLETNIDAPSYVPPPPSYPWPLNQNGPILSTNPLTMSKESPNMISWFPLFFPLKSPVYVSDNSELSLSIWRRTDGRGVWYEWEVQVHALNGSKCGESGWHSSEDVPCLM